MQTHCVYVKVKHMRKKKQKKIIKNPCVGYRMYYKTRSCYEKNKGERK